MGIPIPPVELLPRIGSRGAETFLQEGRDLKALVLAMLPREIVWNRSKHVLDLGCGVGRLLFHLAPERGTSSLTGCDIDRASIKWLTRHGKAGFRVFTNAETPPLELSSGSVDIVCALSVFTHLTDWRPWIDEVARILRPGGVALASYQGRAPLASRGGDPSLLDRQGFVVLDPGNGWADGGPNAYMSEPWVLEHWNRSDLQVQALFIGGLGGYQSVAVLRKSSRLEAPRIGRPFVVQPKESPICIHVDFDPFERSWWDVTGWCGDPIGGIAGWVTSRAGRVISLTCRPLFSDAELRISRVSRPDVGEHHPDLPWASDGGFVVPVAQLCDAHRPVLQIRAVDEAGNVQWAELDVSIRLA